MNIVEYCDLDFQDENIFHLFFNQETIILKSSNRLDFQIYINTPFIDEDCIIF